MRMRLISEEDAMRSLTAEYNKHWKEGGLKLAWIEKAIHDTPTSKAVAEWVLACVELPPDGEKVLLVTQNKKGMKNIVLGYRDAERNCWVCGMNQNVVAWMTLPEVDE